MKNSRQTLIIVGTGPGSPEHLTKAAAEAIESSDTLVGYAPYIKQLGQLANGKDLVTSGMTREIDRCREAIRLALDGRKVALVSGGDAGIYGMAGLVFELLSAEGPDMEVEVIPGISAFQAAASRLGAPLMHDTAIISLSDLLTPWEKIRARLKAAAEADFVVALYNPKSMRRTSQLEEARQIIIASRPPSTPTGIVRNACRPDEQVTVTTLGNLPMETVDMATVIIIGNHDTFIDSRGRMVTPRGYEKKSEFRPVQAIENSVLEEISIANNPRSIMVVGTASDVGKSAIAAGICRLLVRRGLKVAPFKSQNMALNAAVTPEGGEIGRAQASQASACRIPPHTDMNPVLLKPTTDVGSQVILQGVSVGNMTVAQYDKFKPEAFEKIRESFQRLRERSDFIVIEGAGSIAEINLKDRDIANLAVARMAGNAPAILVADIDRGGVFAQVIGSIELMEPWERSLVRGVVINKFRGDRSILEPGLLEIERRCGIPVLGVLHWIPGLNMPAEDSLSLPHSDSGKRPVDMLNIAVAKLPRISNFTDFDPLRNEPDVNICYIEDPKGLYGADMLILPGSKSTAEDLSWLRRQGFEEALSCFGGIILGVCGGFQMIGETIEDPNGIESSHKAIRGLGLIPAKTVLATEKTTRLVRAEPAPGAEIAASGWKEHIACYEIHVGVTEITGEALPFTTLNHKESGKISSDGAVSADGRFIGTYLHGLFDDPGFRQALLNRLRRNKGLPQREAAAPGLDPYDIIADSIENHLDMGALWTICQL